MMGRTRGPRVLGALVAMMVAGTSVPVQAASRYEQIVAFAGILSLKDRCDYTIDEQALVAAVAAFSDPASALSDFKTAKAAADYEASSKGALELQIECAALRKFGEARNVIAK